MARSTNRTYPRQAWVLMPSFKPVEVTIVAPYATYSNTDYGDMTDKGKNYGASEMFDTKGAAIAAGRERLAKQKATLDKQLKTMDKRKAALDLAEKESA